MSLIIKKPGGSKPTGRSTRSARSKPAAKKASSTTKRTTRAKPAAKASTAKKGTTRKASNGGPGSRGPNQVKVPKAVLAKHIAALEKAGKRRKEAEQEHDEATHNVYEIAQAAIAAEIPMTIISEKLDISRQWLYKMGNFRSRGNGNGRKTSTRKPAAKKASTRATSTKKATPKRRSAPKSTGKTQRPKIRIGR